MIGGAGHGAGASPEIRGPLHGRVTYISWFSPRWAMLRERFDAMEWVDKLEHCGFRVVAVMHAKYHDGVC